MPSLLDFTATISLHPSPSISLHSRRLIIPHLDHCNNFLTGLSLSTNFHHLNHITTTSCPHKARSDHVPLLRPSLLCFIHREQPTFSCNIQGSHSRPLKVSVWLQPSCAFFLSPTDISHHSIHLHPFSVFAVARLLGERLCPPYSPQDMVGAMGCS